MTRNILRIPMFAVALFPGFAVAENLDAIRAQTASALASADYVRKHCPNRKIDDGKLTSLVKRSKWSLDQLRADESYEEQHLVLQTMHKDKGPAIICLVISKAHGGYARGVIQ